MLGLMVRSRLVVGGGGGVVGSGGGGVVRGGGRGVVGGRLVVGRGRGVVGGGGVGGAVGGVGGAVVGGRGGDEDCEGDVGLEERQSYIRSNHFALNVRLLFSPSSLEFWDKTDCWQTGNRRTTLQRRTDADGRADATYAYARASRAGKGMDAPQAS